jgi:hypothetical protein
MSPPDGAAEVRQIIDETHEMSARDLWPEPDMGVLRLHRRPPPKLPIEVFGEVWGSWITTAAEAAACPPDYVAAPLLASVSALLWTWPESIPFRLSSQAPGVEWAICALDRLRELELQPGDPPSPIMVPLSDDARAMIEKFGAEMQERQSTAGGSLRSAIGKARGQALRLALGLEFLWWCGPKAMTAQPREIGARAFAAAAMLIADYFGPMAERVYGDAAATERERCAATLARWIVAERPAELHVRHLQRIVRLPGLRTAEQIRAAADALIEADWLHPPAPGSEFGQRGRVAFAVNPWLREAAE